MLRACIALATLLLFQAGAVPAAATLDVTPEKAASSSCEALGFSGLALCSDCDQLASCVKDPQLESECRQCCVVEEDAAAAKYTSAVLEVCGRRVGLYPDIHAFIKDKAAAFPALQMRFRIGAAPKLIMKEEESGESETIRVDSWKTENLELFLTEKLAVGKAAARAATGAAAK